MDNCKKRANVIIGSACGTMTSNSPLFRGHASIAPGLPNDTDTYKFIECIGSGTYSDVFKAESTELKTTVAIKVAKIQGSSGYTCQQDSDIGMQSFLSGFLVPVLDTVPVSLAVGQSRDQPSIGVVMPLANCSLADVEAAALDTKRAMSFLHNISTGLELLHKRGILHLDLKPDNILVFPVSKGDPRGYIAAISDFGMSVRVSLGKRKARGLVLSSVNPVYTLPFRAPEISSAILSGSRTIVVTEASEVFALGLIGLFLLSPKTSRLLSPNGRHGEKFRDDLHLERLKQWCDTSQFERTVFILSLVGKRRQSRGVNAMADLLSRMLSWEPLERPLASEVVSDVAFRLILPVLPEKLSLVTKSLKNFAQPIHTKPRQNLDLVWSVDHIARFMYGSWTLSSYFAALDVAKRASLHPELDIQTNTKHKAQAMALTIARLVNRLVPLSNPNRQYASCSNVARQHSKLFGSVVPEPTDLQRAEMWLLVNIKPIFRERANCLHRQCLLGQQQRYLSLSDSEVCLVGPSGGTEHDPCLCVWLSSLVSSSHAIGPLNLEMVRRTSPLET